MAFPGVGGGGVLLTVGLVSCYVLVGSCGFLSAVVLVVSSSICSSSLVMVVVFVGTWFLLDFLGFFFFSLGFLVGGNFFLNYSAGLSFPSVLVTIMRKAALSSYGRFMYLARRRSISLAMDLNSAVIFGYKAVRNLS